jgi:hypothetical protein
VERILTDSGEWQTGREWAAKLRIRENRARVFLDQLVESGQVESAVGPPGRSSRAHCWRTAPEPRAQSGAVTQSLVDAGTAPTAPTSIGDVGVGAVSGTAPDPGAVGEAPQPGDDDFIDFLEAAVTAGHLTQNEALDRYELHKLIVQAGPA